MRSAVCRWSVPSLGLVALLSFARAANADGLGDLESLLSEQIVTSASKQAEGASAAPALSTSLSSDDLRRYGIKTLAEAIDFLTIGAKTSDNLNGGEIGSRGVLLTGDRGSHFLLLVDGHAMNEPLRGSAWFGVGAGVPIELIDHIEVIVGPGSVLYGSNAMLGLINVVTKRAKDNAGFHAVAEGSFVTSARVGVGYARQFSLLGREGELSIHGEYYRQAGPYMTFGPVNTGVDAFTGNPGRNTRDPVGDGVWGGTKSTNSPYAQVPTALARVVLGNLELNLRGNYYKHSAPTGIGNYDDGATNETEMRSSMDLKYHRSISTLLDVSGRLYGDYFSFQNDLIASRGSLCPYTSNNRPPTCDFLDKGTALWTGLDLQTSWDWLRDARFVTMAGADLRWRSLKTSHDKLNVDTGESFLSTVQSIHGVNNSDVTVGAYLQQTWTPIPVLHFNGGLRVDHDSRFSTVLVKRLSGNWESWKNGLVKIAYAEAFRAPSWDESNDTAAGRIAANVGSIGQPLKPETVKSLEASIQQKLGAHRFLIGGFYSRWENLVQLRQLTPAETNEAVRNQLTAPAATGVLMTQYQNADAIDNYGLNLGIDGAFGYDALQYGLTATLARAKLKNSQPVEPSGNAAVERNGNIAPTLFGNARIAYVSGGNLPTVALAAQFMNERRPDRYLTMADGSTMEPYAPAQVEARLTLSGIVPKVKHLSYRLVANYAVTDRGPYTVGPLMVTASSQTATFEQTPPQLIPVDRLRITFGLQADF
jgi:outer membrane receptor for ferrienterochelin and colicins